MSVRKKTLIISGLSLVALALVLQAMIRRDIHAQGRAATIHSIIAPMMAVCIVGLASYALVERVLLSRLAQLSARVRDIAASADASARVSMAGTDELSALARAFNQILAAIAHAEEVIRHQACHDALTGLPTRTLFEEGLRAAMEQAGRHGRSMATLVFDLDRFKLVNDAFGHAVGDRLLKQAAGRLRECVRASDMTCRLGGDEFAILLPDIEGREEAARVADRILQVFRRPFYIDGHETHVSASIGISLYPADGLPDQGAEPSVLLQRAEGALREVKRQGRNGFQLHSPLLQRGSQGSLLLENELHHALPRGELALHYQPEVEVETGRIVALEGLLRWNHPEHGLLEARDFIEMAEEAGLIHVIGEWVLGEACAQAGLWQMGNTGLPLPRVAVNLSGGEFHAEDLAKRVDSVLRGTGLSADLLELEISERALTWNVERSIAIMQELKERGVHLALDDFGLGQSSLAHMKLFPIDTLKIDQSFVRGIIRDSDDRAIVEAIIAMAHALNLRIVAEGVETEEQFAFLTARGCHAMQGYLFSRPVAATGLLEPLREQCWRAAEMHRSRAGG